MNPSATSRTACCCWRSRAQGYLRLSELLTRAWLENQHRGRAEMKKAWFADGSDGLIALSGAMQGDIGAALLQDNRAAGRASGAGVGAALSRALLSRAAARRARRRPSSYIEPRCASPGGSLPVVATHPVQFLQAGGFHRARGAGVHRRGLRARRPAPARASSRARAISSRRRRWRSSSPTCPRRSPTRSRSRAAAACRWSWARAGCRSFRRPAA